MDFHFERRIRKKLFWTQLTNQYPGTALFCWAKGLVLGGVDLQQVEAIGFTAFCCNFLHSFSMRSQFLCGLGKCPLGPSGLGGIRFFRKSPRHYIWGLGDTIDGSEIPNNHLGCKNTCWFYWDKLAINYHMNWWQDFVGPSTVCILHNLGASSMMSFSDAKWLFVCSYQLLSA